MLRKKTTAIRILIILLSLSCSFYDDGSSYMGNEGNEICVISKVTHVDSFTAYHEYQCYQSIDQQHCDFYLADTSKTSITYSLEYYGLDYENCDIYCSLQIQNYPLESCRVIP